MWGKEAEEPESDGHPQLLKELNYPLLEILSGKKIYKKINNGASKSIYQLQTIEMA